MAYAQDTEVPVSQTKAEVERQLKAAGAVNFFIGETDTADVIGCKLVDRFVRFTVERPDEKWFRTTKKGKDPARYRPNVERELAKEHRRRWRCLGLLIKAKLASVEGGIRTVEQEFLADTMMPDQRTLYEHVAAGIAEAYETGKVRPLLLGPAE